ncbi:MAG TPA: sugar ABC transporter ATP-binding protein [Flexilinea sp.]|jgi:methyl-galactoside transport system ATP-binding protein/inositol transport system ATP-binding protein|nr:sugar ABC transporter ATP-binding protein [Flexilinea sp.]OQA24508.1 MAG: Galactose/methyl galactoside import ATP-binding protein MglA [Chloroflexi bacterium ADurb.Bin344]HOG60717.1 sugar ABC transporter ATP-binding protein [Flexilinea sp.]HOR55606.1 sugar ABC transporter ATP-binding protein [Flexilinea sp.]HOU18977.1 sugar ABC transporter ATP-binding protein [Flexilinea sp.]
MDNDNYLLRMVNIDKSFPGVQALKSVNLNVGYGEVHALVGENGAGKSTLMKCLIGIYSPNGGEIYFDGKKIENYTTAQALQMGISMIHQELSPILYRPIMENLWLGREPVNKFGFVDHNQMYKQSLDVLKEIELDEDPRTLMANLTVAKMQMVEIAKAISYNAKLIIMDEPSSALTEHEEEQLFKIIRKLKESGTSVIYISHRLSEIISIADKVTVMRDGRDVGTENIENISLDQIITMMIGRTMDEMYPKLKVNIGEPILQVKNLSHRKFFKNVSFEVRRGEIFGIAGLIGAGRTEVIETIFGIRPKSEGEILINGKPVEINSPRDAIANRMGFLTEDRRATGIFSVLGVDVNMAIPNYDRFVTKFGFVNEKAVSESCMKFVNEIQIKTPSLTQKIQNLSGGNQQKVLMARWLMTEPDILFLDEPTRGIDVGAKAEIYKLITMLAAEGKCIVMVSSELPEILGMSDRIMVMHEGRVTAILDNGPDITQEVIMRYATGTENDFKEEYRGIYAKE